MKTVGQQKIFSGAASALCWVLLLGLAPNAFAQRQQLHGHVPPAVAHLNSTGRLAATTNLHLSIGLPLRNQDQLGVLLRQLYDPTSPSFRHYLTPEQFTAQFGPTAADYERVVAFATANGMKIRGTHPNRVLLDVEAPVATIERIFQVTLRTYPHPREARAFHAPDTEPSLACGTPILDVSGLDDFSIPRPMSHRRPDGPAAHATPSAGAGPSGSYRGGDFRAAYVPGTALNGAGQSVGLLQFDGYYSNDIASYISQAGIVTGVVLTNVAVNGGIGTPGTGNSEVCMDIELALAMAPGLDKIFVYECPNNSSYWNTLLSRMANDNAAKQLSCSWSGGSSLNATGEQIFQQMAAQGQSFFCASGDCDAFVGTTNACSFPTDSTNITLVGGTTLTTSGAGGALVSETVWNWRTTNTLHGYWGSSGGISANFGLPSFQQGLDMTASQGSASKRNVPDVALTADYIWIAFNNGSSGVYGGTSAAAPLWAGFTALINQRAAANGQSPVGFLNSALYAIGKGPNYTNCFHDTTSGDNTWPNIPNKFYAVAGYDLCTGWGTPNGTNLINALMQGATVLGASPSSCPLSGGVTVTISGIALGVGDVTDVTLCGVPATLLNDLSPSQVVVRAGAALAPGVGDIVVTSTSAGTATLTNGFSYTPLAPNALAATNILLSSFWANWDPVADATNYLLDVSLSGSFSNFVAGYSNLSVGAVTTWHVTGLLSGTNYYYRLRAQQAGLTSENSGSSTVAMPAPSVSLGSGPSAGGNLITITGAGLGNGVDITSVIIYGVAATIQSQTANSVTVLVPAGGQGTGDIVIVSGSQGTTTLKNAYTFQPPGTISGTFQGWKSISNLPAVRAYLGAAAVNGKIYAVGGLQTSTSYQNTVYVFDPAQPTNGWKAFTNLPGIRAYAAVVSAKGKLYAIGGRSANNTYLNTAYVFDPLQPALGWASISNLPATSAGLAAANLNDKLYALGGYNGSYQRTAYVFDPAQPTNSWVAITNLPAGMDYHGAAALNGKVFFLGGYNGAYLAGVYAFDPLRPTAGWSNVTNLPQVTAYLGAAALNGKLYALGGTTNGSTYQASALVCDPAQASLGWSSVSNLPSARRGHAVAQLNDDLYVIGGYNGSYLNTAYKGSFSSGVTPASASCTGGATVTLTGSYLGGGDVTNVTLCGIAATILTDNSPTQIIVSAGASAVATNGAVVVSSTGYGVTTKSNAFTYLAAHVTVTVQASPAQAGRATGGGLFAAGSNILLSATASNGWLFSAWNDASTLTPRTITVPPTNITYTATFEPAVVVTVLANPADGGAVSGGGVFPIGASVPLAAQASNLWLFSAWNDGSTTTPYFITVPATDITYAANFSPLLATNGVPAWWLNQFFGATNNFDSLALADSDSTGLANWQKYFADLNPTNPASRLDLLGVALVTNDAFVTWIGGTNAWQVLQGNDDLIASNAWFDLWTNTPPTPVTNVFQHTGAGAATNLFYRLKAWR